MITETKKILKEIIDLNNKDKDSSGVPFTHIASHLKIDNAKILSTINELENGGFVRVKTTEDEQLQVVHTQKGFEKIYPWRTTKRWLFLFAVLGAIATVFTITNNLVNHLPDLYNRFRSPGEHLVIEHYLVSYDRYFGTTQILRKDIDPLSFRTNHGKVADIVAGCLVDEKDCKVFLYSSKLSSLVSFELNIRSDAPEDPMIINGLNVKLVDYKEIDEEYLDLLVIQPVGGGSSDLSIYDLHHFPLVSETEAGLIPMELLTVEPQMSLGKSVSVNFSCENEGDCNRVIYLQPEEVEGLLLNAYFFEELPPGWYEFELSILYTYNGKQYLSEDKRVFDVVIPQKFHLWYLPYAEQERGLVPGFVDIDLDQLEAKSTIEIIHVSNPKGFLIFRSKAALDYAYYVWDLSTGQINHVGNINMESSTSVLWPTPHQYWDSPPAVDASGWLRAMELILPVSRYDIGVVDIKQGNLSYVARSSSSREFQPAWSPSGNQIAYVVYAVEDGEDLRAGQADIYIYSLQEQESRRVSFTPDIIEAKPTWVDEDIIAFLMPETNPGGYFDSDYVPNNAKVGLGILNLSTDDQYTINEYPVREGHNLKYYSALKLLGVGSTPELFTINGEYYGELPERGPYCRLLNSPRLQQLCWSRESIGIFREDTEEYIELASVEESDQFGLTKIVGDVVPEGFIIADMDNNVIYQYSESGDLIQYWLVPNMDEVFVWGVDELFLVPSD